MDHEQRKPARIALGLLVGGLAVAFALLTASGAGAVSLESLFATESPAPTPSTSCMIALPPGAPTPSPLCQTVTPSPSTEPEPSPRPSKSKKPGKGSKEPVSKVTIGYRTKAALFTGEVSASGKCEDLRRVVVYKLLKGKDERIGKAFTDSSARYSLGSTKAQGQYYALVPASVSMGYANQVDCERLKSQPVRVATPK